MKKRFVLLMTVLCVFAFTGCGNSGTPNESSTTAEETPSETPDESPADSSDQASNESTKDFDGSSYSDTGDGSFLVVTASGNSEGGNVPVIYASPDTMLTQISYKSSGMNGGALSYIYIDGMLSTKEQLADSQGTLDLSGDALTIGTHKVEAVQYENDDTSGNVTVYKSGEFEVKEK